MSKTKKSSSAEPSSLGWPTSDGLSPSVRKRLGKELRAAYGDVDAAPVPSRIRDLLALMDKRRWGKP